MAKHTPEPWEAGEWPDRWAIKAGKYVIASVYKDANNPSEAEANAKLIAAAPDLLELAYCFVGLTDWLQKIRGETPETKEYMQVAKRVIAKAIEGVNDGTNAG